MFAGKAERLETNAVINLKIYPTKTEQSFLKKINKGSGLSGKLYLPSQMLHEIFSSQNEGPHLNPIRNLEFIGQYCHLKLNGKGSNFPHWGNSPLGMDLSSKNRMASCY